MFKNTLVAKDLPGFYRGLQKLDSTSVGYKECAGLKRTGFVGCLIAATSWGAHKAEAITEEMPRAIEDFCLAHDIA